MGTLASLPATTVKASELGAPLSCDISGNAATATTAAAASSATGELDTRISVVEAGRMVAKDFHFTEQASGTTTTYAITAVNTGAKKFTIAGNHAAPFFLAGSLFTVGGSTGNDGEFHVASSEFAGGNTVITVSEVIADATVDGTITLIRRVYSASLPIAAGTRVADIMLRPKAAWAADVALLVVTDTLGGAISAPYGSYFDAKDIAAFVLASETDVGTFNWGSEAAGLFPNGSGSGWGNGAMFTGAGSDGLGIYYESADQIEISITTTLASVPVVPTGDCILTVFYFAAQTATEATVS